MIEYVTSAWVLEHSTDPMDPTEIDWPARQARALIPFEVVSGVPVCPVPNAHEIVYGRNDLPLWGENKMADALVTCTLGGVRYVLLIERRDGGGWAMPGGAIEPDLDEDASMAAQRELFEETGFDLIFYRGPNEIEVTTDDARWVPDPRGSMEAWAVTVVARCDLGEVDALPEVWGGDDARRAEWLTIEVMRDVFLHRIFPAHREILGALR
jgi:ADP-ribose pyrophosphatase